MFQTIPIEEALKQQAIFIDTRTPKEFEEDHLPSAINLPILSNDERAIVGTIYKQVSQEDAINKGVEFFAQKMPDYIKEVSQYKKKPIILYCWRGGMRSKTITSLLDSLGYNVKQLIGGYKSYRAYVKQQLDNYQLTPKICVLWGLTCTGKTALLQKLPNVIDLEGFAQHRGSLYGALGLTPNSQKRFDSLFLEEINKLNQEPYIIVEGESRKIGDVQIPEFFYKAMLKGTHLHITRNLDLRAKEAVKEYLTSEEILTKFKTITQNLDRLLSNKRKQEILQFIENQQYEDAVKILLTDYYDPLYNHTLKKMNFSYEVNNDEEEKAVEEIMRIINSYPNTSPPATSSVPPHSSSFQ